MTCWRMPLFFHFPCSVLCCEPLASTNRSPTEPFTSLTSCRSYRLGRSFRDGTRPVVGRLLVVIPLDTFCGIVGILILVKLADIY
ncbi:hypothetical protein BDV10DRAFT_77953 [Aspergillus recurvatus]